VAVHPVRRPLDPRLVAAVALGGAVGAGLRWALGQAAPVPAGSFPWTTFGINISGSLLLALLPASTFVRRHRVLPPLLGTGLLGGYTTLSTYSEEGRALLAGGHTGLAAAYLLGTLATALVAVAVADRFTTRPARAEIDAEEGDL
jgi:CrcB protein